MARHWCPRCKEECNTLNLTRHICKDVKQRLAKREKQVEAVNNYIITFGAHASNEDRRIMCEGIVKLLMNMGAEND